MNKFFKVTTLVFSLTTLFSAQAFATPLTCNYEIDSISGPTIKCYDDLNEDPRFYAEISELDKVAGKTLVVGFSYENPTFRGREEMKTALILADKLKLKNCSFIKSHGEKVEDFFWGKMVFLQCDEQEKGE